jgi:hypothetical protein
MLGNILFFEPGFLGSANFQNFQVCAMRRRQRDVSEDEKEIKKRVEEFFYDARKAELSMNEGQMQSVQRCISKCKEHNGSGAQTKFNLRQLSNELMKIEREKENNSIFSFGTVVFFLTGDALNKKQEKWIIFVLENFGNLRFMEDKFSESLRVKNNFSDKKRKKKKLQITDKSKEQVKRLQKIERKIHKEEINNRSGVYKLFFIAAIKFRDENFGDSIKNKKISAPVLVNIQGETNTETSSLRMERIWPLSLWSLMPSFVSFFETLNKELTPLTRCNLKNVGSLLAETLFFRCVSLSEHGDLFKHLQFFIGSTNTTQIARIMSMLEMNSNQSGVLHELLFEILRWFNILSYTNLPLTRYDDYGFESMSPHPSAMRACGVLAEALEFLEQSNNFPISEMKMHIGKMQSLSEFFNLDNVVEVHLNANKLLIRFLQNDSQKN